MEKCALLKESDLIKIGDTISMSADDKNIEIARYFTKEKAEKLFETQTLYFSNVSRFDDKNERQIPEGFFKNFSSSESKDFYKKVDSIKNSYFQSYVSCWTKYEYEDYAFWKIYASSNGICIVCDSNAVLDSLESDNVLLFDVEYIDTQDEGNSVDLPWVLTYDGHSIRVKEKYKILPYSYEKEVRFIAYSREAEQGCCIVFHG